MDDLNRREFLKISGAAAAIGISPSKGGRYIEGVEQPREGLLAAKPIELVRIGMVGVGLQGGSHLENFLKIPGCRITAVCDVRDERTTWASKAIVAAGHPQP